VTLAPKIQSRNPITCGLARHEWRFEEKSSQSMGMDVVHYYIFYWTNLELVPCERGGAGVVEER
jgi:hypothetical protein